MGILLKGRPVADAIKTEITHAVTHLKSSDINPTLAIVRMGESADDLAYENSILKSAQALGINVDVFALSADDSQERLMATISSINEDSSIDGCLIFRPLPKHIDEMVVCNALNPEKDVDGIGDVSLAGVFMGKDEGFPPATAEACIRILDHYGIDPAGKHVCVVGRSLVIGRPVGMMLLGRNATVTYCHSWTHDIKSITRTADVVVCATGVAYMFDTSYFSDGQVVLDVGMNVDDSGRLCGDVDAEDVIDVVSALTAVPGGVGSVTTAVLLRHVCEAALRNAKRDCVK